MLLNHHQCAKNQIDGNIISILRLISTQIIYITTPSNRNDVLGWTEHLRPMVEWPIPIAEISRSLRKMCKAKKRAHPHLNILIA